MGKRSSNLRHLRSAREAGSGNAPAVIVRSSLPWRVRRKQTEAKLALPEVARLWVCKGGKRLGHYQPPFRRKDEEWQTEQEEEIRWFDAEKRLPNDQGNEMSEGMPTSSSSLSVKATPTVLKPNDFARVS